VGNEYHNNNKIQRGSVKIIIGQEKHSIFKRGFYLNGKKNLSNLLVNVDIDFIESICGFSREIMHIDNTILYICETNIIKD